MKKLLLLLILALGFVALTPRAEAGQYARVYTNHGSAYVHKSSLYNSNYNGGSRYGRSYYGNSRYRSYGRSNYGYSQRRYYQPVRYSRHNYRSYDDDCYRAPVRYYSSRPRIAVSFGF